MSTTATARKLKNQSKASIPENIDQKGYNRIFSLVYSELENIARQQLSTEFRDTTLKSNDLIHELYLKWDAQNCLNFNNKSHLVRLAAKTMHQILIDHARKKLAEKREGSRTRIELDEQKISRMEAKEFIHLNNACKELKETNKRLYDIIELKYFCGLSISQVAEALEVSISTVDRDWKRAKTWLYYQLK